MKKVRVEHWENMSILARIANRSLAKGAAPQLGLFYDPCRLQDCGGEAFCDACMDRAEREAIKRYGGG